jgi:hypothetical protein
VWVALGGRKVQLSDKSQERLATSEPLGASIEVINLKKGTVAAL